MLREGPVPLFLHGLLEYGAGVVFIAAPFVLGFDAGAAIAVAIVVGVLVIAFAATTEGPTSLVNSLRVQMHVVLDYLLAAFLIASPFLFGFSDEGPPTAFFIAIGVVHLLLTIGTRFLPRREAAAEGRRASRREPAPETGRRRGRR